jgi:hypothetical protein
MLKKVRFWDPTCQRENPKNLSSQTCISSCVKIIDADCSCGAHLLDVHPATPYQQQHVDSGKVQDLNSFGSCGGCNWRRSREIAATGVKDSIQDVVMGGDGHVRKNFLAKFFHMNFLN